MAIFGMAAAVAAIALSMKMLANPIGLVGLATFYALISIVTSAAEDLLEIMGGMDAGVITPLGQMFSLMSTGTDGSISTEFKEIARVLKEDMDFGEVSDMTAMLKELKEASTSLAEATRSTSSQREQTIEVELQLDESATRSLLEGNATTTTGKIVSRAFGTGG